MAPVPFNSTMAAGLKPILRASVNAHGAGTLLLDGAKVGNAIICGGEPLSRKAGGGEAGTKTERLGSLAHTQINQSNRTGQGLK